MGFNLQDNIVAICSSSASFDGALSVFRISGNSLSRVWTHITRKKSYRSRHAYVIKIKNLDGIVIDSAMCIFFKSPKSFTGEDVIEITSHGGRPVAENLMNYFFSLNLRQASRGEFSYRSFINGKMDLLQAESIAELIACSNALSMKHSALGVQGRLSKKIKAFKKTILNLITQIEHELDFLENEIDFTKNTEIFKSLQNTHKELKNIYHYSYGLKSYGSEIRVAIIGPPNVGKSTLFNAILGEAKALVSSIKGTTRDSIDAQITISDNLSITLTDTAGLWDTQHELDQLGVQKTNDTIAKSNVLLLVDDSPASGFFEKKTLQNKNIIQVLSKRDIHNTKNTQHLLSICAYQKKDINNLLTVLTDKIYSFYPFFSVGETLFTSNRQILLLEKSLLSLQSALDLVENKASLDIVVAGLYDFVDILKEMLGEVSSEDVLHNIFDSFCVGK